MKSNTLPQDHTLLAFAQEQGSRTVPDAPSWSQRLGNILTIRKQRSIRWAFLFLPTILTGLYFVFAAADQYESEVRFVVRSAARPEIPGGLAFLVQLGIARSPDDSFIVQDYMTSRDAVEKLRAKMPLELMFSRAGSDFLARYPSILYGAGAEGFYRYFQHVVAVVHADKSGISTLRVRAFRASDARDIAVGLVALSEELVNRMNHRVQTDAVASNVAELQNALERLIASQNALTDFRNRELLIDPVRNAVALGELIARLASELGSTQAQILEMRSSTSGSPQLQMLQRKAVALEEQIRTERTRIADDSQGLASRIAVYERLSIEREFANRMMGNAEAELARSRTEATRQLLYLERVVEPHLPDSSTEPHRLHNVATIFALNLLAVMIGWLVVSGIGDHGG